MTSTQVEGFGDSNMEGYGPSARRFFLRAKTERTPLAGGIELTHRCNLACVHCYVNLPAGDAVAKRREMTTEEVHRVVDELAELGTMRLTLTGGEPLLRADFPAIYRHAHQKGILIVVYTNATLITPRIARLWSEFPPANIEITQYGASAKTFNAVADIAGDPHKKFRAGIERLREAGIRFSLKTIAMRKNVSEVAAMRDFAKELGVSFRFDTVISPRIDGGKGPLAQRLTPLEAAELDIQGRATPQQWADYCETSLETRPPADRHYRCGAGSASFLIDPFGRLHVCELSRRPGWDVLKHGFARGWYEEIPRLVATKAQSSSTCHSCPTESVCSNCVGMAELEGTEVNPYLCELTDERNRMAIGEARPLPSGLVHLKGRDDKIITGATL